MIKSVFAVLMCFTYCTAFAQNLRKIEADIVDEAKAMYNSEWASWYGTDVFHEKCTTQKGKQGGYLSYDDGQGLTNVFYSKGDNPQIITTISFGYGYDSQKYNLDTTTRHLNKHETDLYNMRKVAIAAMGTDTIFKFYKNSNLNPVPLIYKNTKKVYVLTGTNQHGVVIFGNDYQIDFDKNDKIKKITKLHNSIISAQFTTNETDSSKIQVAALHNHVKGKDEFISVTDLCTLMLYAKFTTWNNYYVMSEKYVSIWDCKKNRLAILTREAWDKIGSSKYLKHTEN